jgi:cob(I)alamin adenosyltransferase
MKKGLIHIYTGDGKGKTTSAVGLAIRAKSRGLRVLFAQFMKQNTGGETKLLEQLSIKVLHFENVLSPLFHPNIDKNLLQEQARNALQSIKSMLNQFDLAVLDEFNCLLPEELITEEEAVTFLKEKPEEVELILTGRGATERLKQLADYVTEMKTVKHPFQKGIKARKGIEY